MSLKVTEYCVKHLMDLDIQDKQQYGHDIVDKETFAITLPSVCEEIFTLWYDEEVIGVAGYLEVDPYKADPFVIFSQTGFSDHPVALFKFAVSYLDSIDYPVLESTGHLEFQESHRFLKMLGFEDTGEVWLESLDMPAKIFRKEK